MTLLTWGGINVQATIDKKQGVNLCKLPRLFLDTHIGVALVVLLVLLEILDGPSVPDRHSLHYLLDSFF